MNKKNSMAGIVLITLLLILSGCGGELGGGLSCAPGSDSGDTGICIKSVSITGSDGETVGDHEIDVNIHMCPPDFTEPEDGLFMADATFTIDATATGFDPFPASIEECKITYLKGDESPDSPIIESATVYPNCTLIDSNKNECIMVLMDIDRKVEWWNDANTINFPSTYPTPYTVRYDCTYKNNYGKSGTFQVEYDIWLADWNNC